MEYSFDFNQIPGFGPTHDFAGFYELVVENAPIGTTLVEIGVFHGRSLVQFGLCAKAAKKGLRVIGIDHCVDQSAGCEQEVRKYLKMANLEDDVKFIVGKNLDVADRFVDDSLWFVMIDGEHEHTVVANEIDTWMAKVGDGGWLALHDARWHVVSQPVYAKLDGIIHDSKWDDIFRIPKQVPRRNVDIFAEIPDWQNWYAKPGFRNDGKPSGSW